MTLDILYFLLVSLVETDKYIEVSDGHFVAAKKTGEVQINIRDDNGKPFIYALYNVIFAPDLFDQLFSIVTLMNLVRTFLFHKGFSTVLFSGNKHNVVSLPYSMQRKHAFLVFF